MSSGSLALSDSKDPKPKVVTVKHPESNKPKPTVKKNKPIQADLDVAKEFTKCKDEQLLRLDLSKSSVRAEGGLVFNIYDNHTIALLGNCWLIPSWLVVDRLLR